jgi:hypothetical protein
MIPSQNRFVCQVIRVLPATLSRRLFTNNSASPKHFPAPLEHFYYIFTWLRDDICTLKFGESNKFSLSQLVSLLRAFWVSLPPRRQHTTKRGE